MKHYFALLFSLLLVGSIAAKNEEYPVISAENVLDLQEIAEMGNGAMNDVVAWLPDGGIIVGASRGLYVYENLQAEAEFISLGGNVQSLLFAGNKVFYTDDENLYAYDLLHRGLDYMLEGQKPLAVSHDGQMLAYEVDMGVRILETTTSKVLYDLNYDGLIEAESTPDDDWTSENRFLWAQFSPDDSQLLVRWMNIYSGGWEGRSYGRSDVWTLASLSMQTIQDAYENAPRYLEYAGLDATGEIFMLFRDKITWADSEGQLEGGEVEAYFDFRHPYSLQGNLLAAAYLDEDRNRGTALWDIQTGDLLQSFPLSGIPQLSPDASLIAINRQIFAVATGEKITELQTDTYEFFGENILKRAADGRLLLIDANTLEEIAELPLNQSELGNISGEILIHQNKQLAIWIDDVTGQEIQRFESEFAVFPPWIAWRFNKNQTYALSYDLYDRLDTLLWDTTTGLPLEDYEILSADFVNGDSFLVRNVDSIGLYNPETELFAWTFPYGDEGNPEGIFFDEHYLLLYEGGGTVLVHDMQSQELLFQVETGMGYPYYFVWQGDKMAYMGHDGIIIIRALPDGNILHEIEQYDLGTLRFYNENTIEYQSEFSDETIFFDIATGRAVPDPRQNQPASPILATDTLNFFRIADGVRIEDIAGEAILEAHFGRSFRQMRLSSDGSRLLVLYQDNVLETWAVVEA